MKKFNVEVCELGTITYNVEVEAENEDDARDKVYDNFWDLNYIEDDYESDGITVSNITEITDYHEDNGITCQ
jgi:DNA-dependent RNA polymerase auxiliary subunit epsilon